MSLESWAIDKLSVFLGFDSETLETQIIPYLMKNDTPEAFSSQLMEMVGTSDKALDFIQDFTQRRFFSKPAKSTPTSSIVETEKASPAQIPAASSSTGISTAANPASAFPSLPSNQQPYETMWPANISVKKEDDYVAGLRKARKAKNRSKKTTQDIREAAFPKETKPPAQKKEKKPKKEMTLEAALRELDIKAEKPGKKRKPCQCQATKHPLLTVAPNCLSCGKIICTAEGIGPCTFCGEPVLSKEQQLAVIAEAKRKRAEQKQAQNQPKKAIVSGNSGGMPAYASKLGGGNNMYTYQMDVDNEDRIRAEQHKDKLLEFQRTSAKRSTVIDQATDFELPSDQLNPWLTAQERALLLKKQQSNLRRLEKLGGSSKHKVMTIDVATKQVKVEDVDSPSSSSDDDEEELKHETNRNKETNKDDGVSAGTYAYNPMLKGITAPKFVGKKTKKSKGVIRRKGRVQYDMDDEINDYLYASSVADDDNVDLAHEPAVCQ
ncbi:putative zinc finger motif, C2HC5-type-domain-containing protein [Mycotypha africana]|uniref:putative zinc finger motif, C2HC5-type-domain-containing protein n=1 Tax=Mycotypha africana TaxID=64632 RepID=UPI00230073AA|nr:putative zinc finger motif, C2HC5-type-domain-containing protein [Mycotypha africana]KAI8968481.1 putative zinc finger motif, C2HC5-type-domain-containing protein [Mycotypha africana]